MKKNGIFLVTACIVPAILFLTGCQRDVAVPRHLLGKWDTTEPRYRDRYLKFEEGFLTFGTGKGQEESHYIYNIEAEHHNSETVYDFHYKDSEGERWTLSFVYAPDHGGILQMKNRTEIWKKADSGGT